MTAIIIFDETINIATDFFEPKLFLLIDHLKSRFFPFSHLAVEPAPIFIDKVFPVFTSGGISAFAEMPVEIQFASEKAYFVILDDLRIGIVEISQNNLIQSRIRVGALDDCKQHPLGSDALNLFVRGIKQLAPGQVEDNLYQTGGLSPKIKPIGSQKENELSDLEKLCIEWAGRDRSPRQTMSNFLKEFDENTGIFFSIEQFKGALSDSFKKGLIKKSNGRYRYP